MQTLPKAMYPELPIYKFSAKVWLWQGKGAWHFATINPELSQQISTMFGYLKAGWGSIPVEVTIGNSTWTTSIFPDKKSSGYLLPIKSSVRKSENIAEGDDVTISLVARV
jgi:Domain of unknown function (DUF1905)